MPLAGVGVQVPLRTRRRPYKYGSFSPARSELLTVLLTIRGGPSRKCGPQSRGRVGVHASRDVAVSAERDPDCGVTGALLNDLRVHSRPRGRALPSRGGDRAAGSEVACLLRLRVKLSRVVTQQPKANVRQFSSTTAQKAAAAACSASRSCVSFSHPLRVSPSTASGFGTVGSHATPTYGAASSS